MLEGFVRSGRADRAAADRGHERPRLGRLERRRLLFVSPTFPASGGNGLAMRAGMFLEALAADHEVHLLVVPVAGGAADSPVPPFAARLASRVHVLPLDADPLFGLISRLRDPGERAAALLRYPRPLLCRFATGDSVRDAALRVAETRFDVVHVMRLYLADYARPYLDRRGAARAPACVIDLDESESRTRRRLGTLHSLRGDDGAAALERAEAERYARMEREALPRFDRVLVASAAEMDGPDGPLGRVGPVVVPNAVAIPSPPPAREPSPGPRPFTLLLVGTMGYAPNQDAALLLCREVLPLLRSLTGREARVLVVGSDPPPAVAALAALPGVTVTGRVPDVRPYYRMADVAVAPIRAGGGSRIKILEAFAEGVPVVATRVGAEGLEVIDGEHLLLADEPASFAAACAALARDPALARRLGRSAYELAARRYGRAPVMEAVRTLYRSL